MAPFILSSCSLVSGALCPIFPTLLSFVSLGAKCPWEGSSGPPGPGQLVNYKRKSHKKRSRASEGSLRLHGLGEQYLLFVVHSPTWRGGEERKQRWEQVRRRGEGSEAWRTEKERRRAGEENKEEREGGGEGGREVEKRSDRPGGVFLALF